MDKSTQKMDHARLEGLLEEAAAALKKEREEKEQLKLKLDEAVNASASPFVPEPLGVQMRHIGVNIRKLRKEKGFSSSGFAALCGRASSSVSNIENGQARPSWVTLEKIAATLKVDLFKDIVNRDSTQVALEE